VLPLDGQVDRIPILKLGDFLLVSPQIALHDRAAVQFKQDLLLKIADTRAKGLILDVSGVNVVDSFLIRLIDEISSSVGVMGARVVVTGFRAEVAATLVEMGFTPRWFLVARDLETGIRKLHEEPDTEEG
jgi:rsbT antagonist protein RsbS